MGTKIKRFFKKIRIKRTTVLVLVFVFMSATLVRQLFELQIIQGEAYISKFESRTTKKRVIKSTRGNIYDRNGEELATNVLAYSVTFEDNGTYDSTREKNLTLNGIAYKVLKILESNGDSISTGFHIVLDESGNYAFDVDEGFTLNRFRADIYGEPLIDNLTKKQKNATADQMIEFMSGKEGFSIVLYGDNAYTKEELTSHGLPENLSKQDILELSKIRYALSTNSFKKYMAALTMQADGSLFFGGNIFETAPMLEEMGADAVGINCSTGPDQLENIIQNLAGSLSVPVIAKPNAGMPTINDQGIAVYDMTPEYFGKSMKRLVDLGASMVGGCCGTDPSYIKALVNAIR